LLYLLGLDLTGGYYPLAAMAFGGECLEGCDFPGNIRELKNLIERVLIKWALAQTSEKLTSAARLLDTNRSRIYRALGKSPDSV
jgi:transcriptional regulator with GAF, ATPase, and Fis domain